MRRWVNLLLGHIGYRVVKVTTIAGKDKKVDDLNDFIDSFFWAKHESYVREILLPRAERVKAPEALSSVEAFTKQFSEKGNSGPWTPRARFLLELDCLSRLNSLAWSVRDRKPFPIILEYSLETLTITMSNCGKSLDRLEKDLEIPDAEAQVKRIAWALHASEIVYLDMHPSGKNLCANHLGQLSIIDFDVASLADGSLPEVRGPEDTATEMTMLSILRKNPYVKLV